MIALPRNLDSMLPIARFDRLCHRGPGFELDRVAIPALDCLDRRRGFALPAGAAAVRGLPDRVAGIESRDYRRRHRAGYSAVAARADDRPGLGSAPANAVARYRRGD